MADGLTGKELLGRNYPPGSPARVIAETVAELDETLEKAEELKRKFQIQTGIPPVVVADENKS